MKSTTLIFSFASPLFLLFSSCNSSDPLSKEKYLIELEKESLAALQLKLKEELQSTKQVQAAHFKQQIQDEIQAIALRNQISEELAAAKKDRELSKLKLQELERSKQEIEATKDALVAATNQQKRATKAMQNKHLELEIQKNQLAKLKKSASQIISQAQELKAQANAEIAQVSRTKGALTDLQMQYARLSNEYESARLDASLLNSELQRTRTENFILDQEARRRSNCIQPPVIIYPQPSRHDKGCEKKQPVSKPQKQIPWRSL